MAEKIEIIKQITMQFERLKKEKEDANHIITEKDMEIQEKKATIDSVNQQNDKLKQEKVALNKQIQELNKRNLNLLDECKELKHDLMDIKTKYNQLLSKSNIDEGQYESWDSDDIVDWILSLSDDYKIYEDELRKNLKEESAEGAILVELDKNDWHRFGVKSVKHKIDIIKNIKRITSKQSQQQFISLQNEGINAPTAYI